MKHNQSVKPMTGTQIDCVEFVIQALNLNRRAVSRTLKNHGFVGVPMRQLWFGFKFNQSKKPITHENTTSNALK